MKQRYTLKDFAPLLTLFAIITFLSYFITVQQSGDLMQGMRIFMGLFFGIFGLLKLLKLKDFAHAFTEYDLIAKRSITYAYIYPFIELALAGAYLTNVKPVLTNWATLILMSVSALGVFLVLRKKEEITCACMGTVFKMPMTWVTLAENVLMALMAAYMLFGMSPASAETKVLSEHVPAHAESVQPSEIIELSDGDTLDLTASIVTQEVGGRTIKRLAYNGQIPGPLIKAQKDATITVNLTNNLDVETTLHSHGLRLENRFDGVPDVTQEPIEIGETFTYELTFPDEGIYWYHPHIREDYTQELGLYGNFLVEGDEGYWNNVSREEFLILDDFAEDEKFYDDVVTHTLMGRYGNKLLINDREDYNVTVEQGAITRLYLTNVANTRTFEFSIPNAMVKLVGGDIGRIENEVFVDHIVIAPAERYVVEVLFDEPGTYPIEHRGETLGTITVQESSENQQLAFNTLRTNTSDYASIRNQMSSLLAQAPDKSLRATIEMKGMMGGRGRMMQDGDTPMSRMMDGERGMGRGMMGGRGNADDEFMREHCKMMLEMPGCEPYLKEGAGEKTYLLMGIEMTEEQAREHCEIMPGMVECGQFLDDEDFEPVDHAPDGIEWEDEMAMMNTMSTDETLTWVLEDTATKKRNEKIDDWNFKVGNLVKVRIFNDPKTMHPMQHPIHFHGQRFVVLAGDDVPNENLQWKDTVLVRKGEAVDLLIEMSNPGQWMTHCHIAEHMHSGMMFMFEVSD